MQTHSTSLLSLLLSPSSSCKKVPLLDHLQQYTRRQSTNKYPANEVSSSSHILPKSRVYSHPLHTSSHIASSSSPYTINTRKITSTKPAPTNKGFSHQSSPLSPCSSSSLHTIHPRISTFTRPASTRRGYSHPLFHQSPPFTPPSHPYTIHTRNINTSPSDAIVVELSTDPIINASGDPVLLITGPVSLFEVGLAVLTYHSAIHSLTGLPWWAIIVGLTLILRTALTPLAYKQRVNMVHTINVYPDMARMAKERKGARERGDVKMVDKLYQEMLTLTSKYNVSPLKNFMVLAVQVPVLVCFFFALSDMAATFPSFATGGFFETSLSARPIWWAPLLSFLPGIIANEMSSPIAKLQIVLKWAIRGLYMVAIPFSYLLPTAIMYYWIPSNLFSVVQSYILNNAEISKRIGIPDVKSPKR